MHFKVQCFYLQLTTLIGLSQKKKLNIPQVKGLYYQYDIVELLPFSPPICNIRTHFWVKDMRQSPWCYWEIFGVQTFGCSLGAWCLPSNCMSKIYIFNFVFTHGVLEDLAKWSLQIKIAFIFASFSLVHFKRVCVWKSKRSNAYSLYCQ